MTENNAVKQNFKNLHDDENGTTFLEALTGRIVLSGDEGIKKFIHDHTFRITDINLRARAVALLAGIFAKEKQDLKDKIKK